MSYKYSKGSQVIGDLKAADDTQRDTLIDFGEDVIDFQTSGSSVLKISGSHVYLASGSDLHLFGRSRIYFDSDDVQANVMIFERDDGDGLIIDGNNRVRFRADDYVIFQAPNNSEPMLVNFNSSPYQLKLQMLLSSSQPISASAFYSAGDVVIDNGSDLTFQKGADDIAFIKFRDGADGTSYNGYLGYSAAEDIYISAGRGADFFVQSRTTDLGDPENFPFTIMDDGTAKFTKGLTSVATRSADLTASTAFYVSGTQDGNNNAIFLSRVGIGTEAPTEILTLNGTSPIISFKEADANRAEIGINDSDNLVIENKSANRHIVFKVNDGGTVREGLRLDGAVPEVVVNQNSSSLIDFRVESTNQTHMLFVDGGNDRVGLGVSTPAHSLEVSGNVYLSGALSHGDVMLLELSVPNVDLQTDTYAHRIYAPYNIDVDNVFYILDSHNTSGNVTVTLTNTTTNTQMSSVTLAGTALTGSDFSITSASVAQGDALTFAITNAEGASQGLHASLYFRRSI